MINLITGTPGSGKTSYALKFMLDQLKGSKRKIYVHGIPDLKIPHEQVYCSSKTCDHCGMLDVSKIDPSLMADRWHEFAPIGAVYFLDEAQNIYRPRSSSSKVPESVAAFEVHRHKGIDFFLITQNPRLIDANIRALVSRHIHLKPTWAGRFQYEWPETKDSVQSTTDAIRSTYKLDKKTFDLYKSASIHTKQKRVIPTALYVILLSFLALSFLSYKVYHRMNPEKPTTTIAKNKEIKTPVAGADAKEDTATGVYMTESKAYTNKQLLLISYKLDYKEDNLPISCNVFSSKTYKCLVPKSLSKRYKQSFCDNDVCFTFLPFPTITTEPIEVST